MNDAPTRQESAPVTGATARVWPLLPPVRDTLFVLVSIFLADFLLYDTWGGTGYGLLLIAWAIGFLLVTPQRRREGVLLFLMAVALGLRNLWQTGLLPVLLPAACLAAGAAIQRLGTRPWLDAMFNGAVSVPAGLNEWGGHLRNIRRVVTRPGTRVSVTQWLVPAFGAGVVILIFGSIFVSANPVVERFWDWLWAALSLEELLRRLGEIIPDFWQVILWGAAATATAGLLAPSRFLFGLGSIEDQRPRPATAGSDLAGRTALGALGAACLLFAAYILVDVNYLFIHAQLPPGISDSDYARHGTFWLTVALLLSTVFIGRATAESELASRWTKPIARLALLWIGLDLLMGVCVLGRIRYYILVSGLTPLRIIGLFGTFAVAAGVIVMGLKVRRRKNLVWLVRRYAVIFLVGLTAYTLLPRDTICSWYNVRRAAGGDLRPLMLLFRAPMPPESLPEYLALLDHPDPVVADGIAAYLAERRAALEREDAVRSDTDWRQHQWASTRARDALAAAGDRLHPSYRALEELARACGGYNEVQHEVSEAWRTGQSSDLEWIDD